MRSTRSLPPIFAFEQLGQLRPRLNEQGQAYSTGTDIDHATTSDLMAEFSAIQNFTGLVTILRGCGQPVPGSAVGILEAGLLADRRAWIAEELLRRGYDPIRDFGQAVPKPTPKPKPHFRGVQPAVLKRLP